MSSFPHPVHTAGASDDILSKEAGQFVIDHPPLQVLTELISILRAEKPRWYTPETMLGFSPVAERMLALESRPDIRKRLLVELTSAKPKTALRTPLEMQGRQLMIAIEAEDVSVAEYELAHEPVELALYLDAGALWRFILNALPWEANEEADKNIVALLVSSLISQSRKKTTWSPSGAILTAWDLMHGIDARVWNQHLPLDLRVKIHQAWVEATRDGSETIFAPKQAFEIVPPEVFMQHFKLLDLRKILELAEKRMGFEAPPPPVEEPAPATRFEGRHSTKPPAASDADTPEAQVDALFSDVPPPPATAGSVPTVRPEAAAVAEASTADPMGDAPKAPMAEGVPPEDSSVISVRVEELSEADVADADDPPPSKDAPAEPHPSETGQAVEIARMMMDLDKHGIKTDGDPQKVRRVHAIVQAVLQRSFAWDEAKLSKDEIAMHKEELREVLVLFDAATYGHDRYARGVVSLSGFLAKLEHHLKMENPREGSGPISIGPPRQTGRQTQPPPLPGSDKEKPDASKTPGSS